MDGHSPIKRCTQCGRELPATREFFTPDRRSSTGLLSACKECCKQRQRVRRLALEPDAAERYGKIDEQRTLLQQGFKRCTACERILPATRDFFSPAARGRDGLTSRCKECVRDAARARAVRTDPSRRGHYEYIDGQAQLVGTGLRLCKDCKRTLPATDEFFYRTRSGACSSRCRECTTEASKAAYWRGRTAAQVEASAERSRLRAGGLKRCPSCERELPLDAFYWHRSSRTISGFVVYCKDCKARRERDFKLKLKRRVIDHYGGRCECCGETDLVVLTLDHVLMDGAEHRRTSRLVAGWQTYAWIERHDFPAGFQVLCSNCNSGRAHNKGVCPHTRPVVPPSLILPCAKCGRPASTHRPLCAICLDAVRREHGGSLRNIGQCVACGATITQAKTAATMLCATCRKERTRRLVRNHMRGRRLKVLTHYSDGQLKCASCGESEYGFLAIDHVASDGAEHRRAEPSAARLDSWLLSNGLPEGFQVLCYNCNWKKYASSLGVN